MVDAIVDQLATEWREMRALVAPLNDTQWHTPTALPGWTVQDCVSHVTGTERMLMGDPAPTLNVAHLPHVKNPFGEIVEVWVEERRTWTPNRVLSEFDEQIARRVAQLHAISDEELDALTASPLGEMSEREWLKVRVFDSWMHEQDIRRALELPGHLAGPIVDTSLERFEGALGYVVGKKAGAPDGSIVVFAIEGEPNRTITVEVDGRAQVVPAASEEPTVMLTMPLEAFIARGGGRASADETEASTTIDGDEALGRRVLESLAFTP